MKKSDMSRFVEHLHILTENGSASKSWQFTTELRNREFWPLAARRHSVSRATEGGTPLPPEPTLKKRRAHTRSRLQAGGRTLLVATVAQVRPVHQVNFFFIFKTC